MSTQLRSDLKSIAPTSVSRSAMNPFGAKDLTALAATLSPVGRAAREALIATAPYRPPWATDTAAIAAGHFNAPSSALKAAGQRSLGRPRTSERCQDDARSIQNRQAPLAGWSPPRFA